MKNEEKEHKKSKDELKQVSEPESLYAKNRLRGFGSFEEMNEADAAEMAAVSGLEHLMNVTALLKRIYATELKSKMDMKLHRKEGWTSSAPEHKALLLLLITHKVQFMLIGGYAVIFYGYERSTSDMDIWLKPDNENRDRLADALEEFGIEKHDLEIFRSSDFSQVQFYFFGEKPQKIDFLNKIQGVEFDEAFEQVNHFPLQDKEVPIIQYHHLILSKIMTNRGKDKADVEELQRINAHKK